LVEADGKPKNAVELVALAREELKVGLASGSATPSMVPLGVDEVDAALRELKAKGRVSQPFSVFSSSDRYRHVPY
jgi:hypothetical protein